MMEEIPISGVKNRKTPRAVATPFPPRSFKKQEKQCPNTAHNPIQGMRESQVENLVAVAQAKTPFDASRVKASPPSHFP
jgi:hypothetical protein